MWIILLMEGPRKKSWEELEYVSGQPQSKTLGSSPSMLTVTEHQLCGFCHYSRERGKLRINQTYGNVCPGWNYGHSDHSVSVFIFIGGMVGFLDGIHAMLI
jgi:hypothetical protein